MNKELYVFISLMLGLAITGPQSCLAAAEEIPGKSLSSGGKNDGGRFIIQGSDYTINFLPFLILIKLAFILGLLLKDVIAKEMEEYVTGYYVDETPNSYYQASSSQTYFYGDPTRIYDVGPNEVVGDHEEDFGNINYYHKNPKALVRNSVSNNDAFEVHDDYETAAAALDLAVKSVADFGIGVVTFFADLLVGPDHQTDHYTTSPELEFVSHNNINNNDNEEILQKGDFLRSLSVTPAPNLYPQSGDSNQLSLQSNNGFYNPTAQPAHYTSTLTPNFYPASMADNYDYATVTSSPYASGHYYQGQNSNLASLQTQNSFNSNGNSGASLFFDPNSSTLYVDANLANSLHLDDGTSVELPTDVLLNSIHSGQVQLIHNRRNGDFEEDQFFAGSQRDPVAVKARVSPGKSRHESIKDLLHFQSNQKQFRPNPQIGDDSNKIWAQINTPSRFSYKK